MDEQMPVGPGAVERAKPQPETSLLVCINCGEISVINADWSVRKMTEKEARSLPPDVIHLLAQCEEARQAALRAHNRNPFPEAGRA